MRITFVAPFGMQPKGTTRWRALPLAKALAARGHAVRLLVPSWDQPGDVGRRWTDGDVDVLCIPFPPGLGAASWPVLLMRLYREAMRGNPDVLHAIKPIGFSGAVASAAIRFRRGDRPVVWVDADDYEAEWARAQARPRWMPWLLARQERRVLSGADGVTVASHALAELVAQWRGREPVWIPNTSELEPLLVPEAPGRVVWYTRFLDYPADAVADIWAAVVAARPTPAPMLHVVGKGLHGEESALLAAMETRRLSSTVAMHGWLEPPALSRVLGSACVAMLPFADTGVNRYKCPARLADLVRIGVPVVAHDVGEVSRYVKDRETGIVLPPGDTRAFAGAVIGLLARAETGRQMRAAARRLFAAEFAPAILAARLEEAYGKLS